MVYYTGDIHGNAKAIVAFAQYFELTESDTIVILGDVGANYYGNRRDRYCKDALARIKPTVFCIHGNHERRPDTLTGYKQKEWNSGLVWYEDGYPNLLFARDGDIFTMEGTRHLVIGGAYSVDKYYRLENDLLWFADEQPSAEIKTFALRSEVAAFQNDESDSILDFVSVDEYRKMEDELKKAYQYFEWNDRSGAYRYYEKIQKKVAAQVKDWKAINPRAEITSVRIMLFST